MDAPDPGATAVRPADGRTDADRVELLERRLERERAARRESERIAESGLRRLWEAKNDLDRRVEERTAQLHSAQQRAQAASDAKTEFLANLSHEVRTPLQTIMSALELAAPSDPDDRDRHHQAVTAAADLRDLFDALLELAECEVGSIEVRPRPTDLERVADELVGRWQARLTGRGLLLVPESSGTADVDPIRLAQIADALLDNASKFAHPGTVALRLVARPAGGVEMEVRDSGPGVPAEQMERMFEPFVQLHGANDRVVGGAGIGLALVHGITRCMGGTVHAAGAPDGGLSVAVQIPGGEGR
jgi:signal transduction histidine kinase